MSRNAMVQVDSESPAPTFRPARSLRAVEDITAQIRTELESGRLRPGQRLPPERDLAAQLNVSRSTVREAMGMLEVAGLLQRRIGSAGGSFIAQSNATAVARSISDAVSLGRFSLGDLVEARLALDSFVARKACEVGTEAEFDALDANLDRTLAIPDTDWETKLLAYREFLDLFIAIARNPLIADLAEPLMRRTSEVARRLGPTGDNRIIDIRRQLIAAMRARDAEAATRAVKASADYIQAGWLARSAREPSA
jgi:DNA-binding FadR family transcriptional regulator